MGLSSDRIGEQVLFNDKRNRFDRLNNCRQQQSLHHAHVVANDYNRTFMM